MRLHLGATLDQLAQAMAQVESGGSTSALSVKNNNPLNLTYAGQAGATKDPGTGLAVFPTYAAGYSAGVSNVQLDLTRGTCATGAPTQTLSELLSCWASPTAPGNSQASYNNYVSSVSGATGIDPNADLNSQLNGATDSTVFLSDTGDIVDDPTSLLILAGLGVFALWALNS